MKYNHWAWYLFLSVKAGTYRVRAEYEQVTPALAGNILGEDVHAPQNVPSSKTTSVDGYALRC